MPKNKAKKPANKRADLQTEQQDQESPRIKWIAVMAIGFASIITFGGVVWMVAELRDTPIVSTPPTWLIALTFAWAGGTVFWICYSCFHNSFLWSLYHGVFWILVVTNAAWIARYERAPQQAWGVPSVNARMLNLMLNNRESVEASPLWVTTNDEPSVRYVMSECFYLSVTNQSTKAISFSEFTVRTLCPSQEWRDACIFPFPDLASLYVGLDPKHVKKLSVDGLSFEQAAVGTTLQPGKSVGGWVLLGRPPLEPSGTDFELIVRELDGRIFAVPIPVPLQSSYMPELINGSGTPVYVASADTFDISSRFPFFRVFFNKATSEPSPQ